MTEAERKKLEDEIGRADQQRTFRGALERGRHRLTHFFAEDQIVLPSG